MKAAVSRSSASLAAFGFALIHGALALLALEPAPHAGGDNAVYLSLARSLLERGDYTELWDPALASHVHFPPAFPALLALGLWLGLKPWIGLKILIVVCSAAAVGFSHLWLRRIAAPAPALAATALLAFSPGLIEQSHWVLSDIPFWLWSAAALYAFARFAQPSNDADRRTSLLLFAGGSVAVLLAYFTRSAAALPLIAALGGWLLMQRRFKLLALFAAAIVPLAGAWWLRSQSLGAPGYSGLLLWVDPYQPALGTISAADFVERISGNIRLYGGKLTTSALLGPPIDTPWIGVAIWLLAGIGWIRRLRNRSIETLWLPLYSGLLLAWSTTWAGERLLLPIAPLLLLLAVEAAAFLLARVRAQRLAPYVLGTVLLLYTPLMIGQVRRGVACRSSEERLPCMDPVWRDLLLLGEDLRGKLPEGSVVLSRKPSLFFVFSGYRGRTYPLSEHADSFFHTAERLKARYVVVDQAPDLAPLYLHPVMLARRADFCVIAETLRENAVLARIDTAGPPRPPDAAPNSFRTCGYTE